MPGLWKSPPRAKVYEALSAIADERVMIGSQTSVKVTSSSGDKNYDVQWSMDQTQFGSNDNASFYQGYLGYPIIAVLLSTGTIPYERSIAGHLAGIHWKALNTKHKRNYDAAVEEALNGLSPTDRNAVEREVDAIFERVKGLKLERLFVRQSQSKN